jgi:hypothetical protein
LLGFCSGADNAWVYAEGDPRVASLALFDPWVHATAGFHVRRLMAAWRTTPARVPARVLRAMWRALRPAVADVPPPEYYGVLLADREASQRIARALTARRVRRLHLLSGGVADYCNAPHQLREALADGFSSACDDVRWVPQVDHLLSRAEHVRWLATTVGDWFAETG